MADLDDKALSEIKARLATVKAFRESNAALLLLTVDIPVLVKALRETQAQIAAVRAQIKWWSDMADEAANAGTESGRYNAHVYRDMIADLIRALDGDGAQVKPDGE